MVIIKFIGRSLNGSEKIGPFLDSIFGIGFKTGYKICKHIGLLYSASVEHVSSSKLSYIESCFTGSILDQDLQRYIQNRISDKIRSGSYAGLRLSQGLPSRGQRTKTNANTCKKKSTVKIIKKSNSLYVDK